jgi:hypothetical protein
MDTQTTLLVAVAILIVVLSVVLVKLEAAREDAGFWRGTAIKEAEHGMAMARLHTEAIQRNDALVDRMGRMQREGFVDLLQMEDEPVENTGDDGSEREDWPEMSSDVLARERERRYRIASAGPMKGDWTE